MKGGFKYLNLEDWKDQIALMKTIKSERHISTSWVQFCWENWVEVSNKLLEVYQ